MKFSLRRFSEAAAVAALAVERHRARCYRQWADRLRPYDLGASGLLDQLAEEKAAVGRDLEAVAQALFSPEAIKLGVCKRAIWDPVPGHFFIVASQDAATLLDAAAWLERRANRFYARCAARERHPRLRQCYERLRGLERVHLQVLRDVHEAFALRSAGVRPALA